MKKDAHTDYDIHLLLKQRWSPRAFSAGKVDDNKILSILEAARWAPSSLNQQPWRFILCYKGTEAYDKLFGTLVEFNQVWAKAPVLILTVGKTKMNMNDDLNSAYMYDVGQAVATLTIQATYEGLFVHQMGGFDKEKTKELFEIPSNYLPITILAVGNYGDSDLLPEKIRILEFSPRIRTNLEDFVYSDIFGHKSEIFTKK